MERVRQCANLLGHIHINENTGDFEPMRINDFHMYNTLSMSYRMTFGRSDIHIPPFWGNAPLEDALKIIINTGYDGIFLCEYNSHLFKPFNASIYNRVKQVIENV